MNLIQPTTPFRPTSAFNTVLTRIATLRIPGQIKMKIDVSDGNWLVFITFHLKGKKTFGYQLAAPLHRMEDLELRLEDMWLNLEHLLAKIGID